MADLTKPASYLFETNAEVAEWRVLSFELEEALSEPYVGHIRVCQPAHQGDDPRLFSGASCALVITREDTIERRQCGVVSRVTCEGVRCDHVVLVLEIRPALYALSQRVGSRIFQDMDAKEIIGAVLADGLVAYDREANLDQLTRTFSKREFTVQHREADLAFIARLMAEEGIAYFFDHGGQSEQMILFDSTAGLPTCETLDGGEIPLATASEYTLETIRRLTWGWEMQPTSVVTRDFDWTQPAVDLTREARGADAMGRDRELYEAGAVSTIGDYRPIAYGSEDGQEQAQLRQQALETRQQRGAGSSVVINMRPGALFEITGQADELLAQRLLVTTVRHRGANRAGLLLGGDESNPDYENAFECVPSSVPYRPPRCEPEARVLGPQTATVVGPAGEEVYTDEHGRIKVQFHWDREGANDEFSSCFLRVAQTWAGQGFGCVFIPRIGMEVVVHFLDGNPDRPLITGCLYNGQNPPPHALPDAKTKSSLTSQSSLGGGGFNELTFEDAKGAEEIYLHAQKDYNTDVLNDHNLAVGSNQDLEVTGNRVKHVAGDQTAAITGNDDATISGNRTLTVGGNDASTIIGDRALTLAGNDDNTTAGSRTVAVRGDDALSVSGNAVWGVSVDETHNVGGSMTINIGGGHCDVVSSFGALIQHVTGSWTGVFGSTDWQVNGAKGGSWDAERIELGAGVTRSTTVGVDISFTTGISRQITDAEDDTKSLSDIGSKSRVSFLLSTPATSVSWSNSGIEAKTAGARLNMTADIALDATLLEVTKGTKGEKDMDCKDDWNIDGGEMKADNVFWQD